MSRDKHLFSNASEHWKTRLLHHSINIPCFIRPILAAALKNSFSGNGTHSLEKCSREECVPMISGVFSGSCREKGPWRNTIVLHWYTSLGLLRLKGRTDTLFQIFRHESFHMQKHTCSCSLYVTRPLHLEMIGFLSRCFGKMHCLLCKDNSSLTLGLSVPGQVWCRSWQN